MSWCLLVLDSFQEEKKFYFRSFTTKKSSQIFSWLSSAGRFNAFLTFLRFFGSESLFEERIFLCFKNTVRCKTLFSPAMSRTIWWLRPEISHWVSLSVRLWKIFMCLRYTRPRSSHCPISHSSMNLSSTFYRFLIHISQTLFPRLFIVCRL